MSDSGRSGVRRTGAERTVRAPRFAPPRRGATEQIAAEIRRYVLQQGLVPDDRLGTEQELAEEFGVSRPTIREALRGGGGSHLVRATKGPGGGIFVASTANEGMGRSLSESIATMLETENISLSELVDARISLEVPLAGRAAANATARTVAALEAAIAEAESHEPGHDAFRNADTRFHEVLATTARNELLRAFTSWTLDVLQPSLVVAIGPLFDAGRILDQHRAIARAVGAKDPAAAQDAMRVHLEYVLGLVQKFERKRRR